MGQPAGTGQPGTMALTITRPALRNALQPQGIDPDAAPPEQMRDYVCAQCHVEYYFQGEGNQLVFPWANGVQLDSIKRFYAAVGVSCADCHMPRVQFQGSEITDHWIRSPMQQVQQACMGCHRGDAARMTQRTQRIQQSTDALLAATEPVLNVLMDARTARSRRSCAIA